MTNDSGASGALKAATLFMLSKLTADLLVGRLLDVDPEASREIDKIHRQVLIDLDNAKFEIAGVSDDDAQEVIREVRHLLEGFFAKWQSDAGKRSEMKSEGTP